MSGKSRSFLSPADVTPGTAAARLQRPLRSDHVTTGRRRSHRQILTGALRTSTAAKSARPPGRPVAVAAVIIRSSRAGKTDAEPGRAGPGRVADTIDRARRCNYEESLLAIVIEPRACRISTTTPTDEGRQRISRSTGQEMQIARQDQIMLTTAR